MLTCFSAPFFRSLTRLFVACGLLTAVVPVSRAEHGDPYLIVVPVSGERIDPNGTVMLLSENGPELTVVGPCAFRFVAGETVTEAITVRVGRGVDHDGYGSSFRVVRAVRRLPPGGPHRLEARCRDEQSFAALPVQAPEGSQPGTFVVDDRAAEPPVIEAIELGESPWRSRMVTVQLAAAGTAVLLVETLGTRARVSRLIDPVDIHQVLIDEPVRRIRITPLSRGFRRGRARTVVMPRASITQGQSFYVAVRETAGTSLGG